ncbi:MAG TPA: hypothetical protein DEH78_12575 [Solibacterales bacterium]|nr:hypothetical protein [Bryobacterales bacterium]
MLLVLLLLATSALAAGLERKADAGLLFGIADGKLRVAETRPGGNAARAGIRVGDVLLTADGGAAPATREFARSVYKRKAGDSVVLRLLRDGAELEVTLHYPAPPPEPAVEHGAVLAAGFLRRTLVTAPPGPGPHAALLWIAGSGCGSQESPGLSDPVAQLLHALTAQYSIVTMRVEKSGAGDSDGPPCYSADAGLAQESESYGAALEALQKDPRVDPARVFLVAHSAGVLSVPIVAAGRNVAGIVAAGGSGFAYFDYHLAMRRREMELAGKPEDEVEASLAIHRRCLTALLKEHRSPDEIEKEMPDCRRRVRFDSPPVMIEGHSRIDSVAAWKSSGRAPVLLLYGTGDFVTSKKQTEALRDLINRLHPRRAAMKVLPMDHGFLAHETEAAAWAAERAGKGGALSAAAVAAIGEWIGGAAGRQAKRR